MTDAANVRQIRPKLLYETAADEIRRAILARTYGPGSRINEVELARDLNLSRGPVREALRALEHEGLVLAEPQKGVRVQHTSSQEFRNALALRTTLETLSLHETVAAVTDRDITALRQLMTEMSQAETDGDILTVIDLDYEFHERFLEIAPSAVVRGAWRAIAGQIRMYLAIGDSAWAQSGSVAVSHEPIVVALEARDELVLHDSVLAHIEENRASIGASMPETP
ncbi:GntR family transcriptional regulator [Mycobacterium sp. NPDC003449]